MSYVIACLRAMLAQWQDYLSHQPLRSSSSYSAPLTQASQHAGRPKFDISSEQIQYLRSMSFSWVQISEILGVSYMTVYRRRQEWGMLENSGKPM